MNCYPSCCFFFSHLSTVTFFPVTFFPTWNCYFLSCFFFSHLSTVTFFPVTFFPVTFFPTWNCYFLSCYLFSCYFLSVHRRFWPSKLGIRVTLYPTSRHTSAVIGSHACAWTPHVARHIAHARETNITYISVMRCCCKQAQTRASLIARFMGPTWGPSGADRIHVGPMLAPWTLLSGI